MTELGEIRTKDLSLVEILLQNCIQDINVNIHKDFQYTNSTKQKMKASYLKLRQEMRTLRRWRNGTELWSRDDLDAFSRNLVCLRLETIKTRIGILRDTLDDINELMQRLPSYSDNVTSQRDNIGIEIITVNEKVEHVEGANGKGVTRCEKEVTTIENESLNLRKFLYSEIKKSIKRSDSRPSSGSSRELKINFEDHPEVNNVLRNAGNIRRMMEALWDGGHVNIDDSASCMGNDIEVLRRQLRKVQQWQQCEVGFGRPDVDDLELILSAIERHIRPDVDLDSFKKITPNTSRSNSRSSNKSHESFYTDPPPITTEAPPPYESCVIGKNKCASFSDEDDDTCDIIDERLI